jgi:fructose-1,6-bisphosphatase/inositol monophosphatase family enzyme
VSLPDPEKFVRVLAPAVRQAAAIARALEGRVTNRPKARESTAAKQALTLADTAAQEALLVPLLERFPDLRLEAEEDTPSVAQFRGESEALVVIDPVDGTLHYYLGAAGPYAVMVGLALGGRYAAALVALPREGLFFEAVRGRGASAGRAGAPARPARLHAGAERVLVSHDLPEAALAFLRERGAEPRFGCGGALAVAPLVAGVRAGLRFASGATGISRRGRIGALIAQEAGARVCAPGGAPFPEEIDAPARGLLVCSADEDVALLSGALEAAGLAAPPFA